MKCEEIANLITDQLAGELNAEQQAILTDHLAECENCKKEYDEFQEIWNLAEITIKADSIIDELPQTHREQIFKSVEKSIFESQNFWFQIAASIAVVGFVGFLFVDLPKEYESKNAVKSLDVADNYSNADKSEASLAPPKDAKKSVSIEEGKESAEIEESEATDGKWETVVSPAKTDKNKANKEIVGDLEFDGDFLRDGINVPGISLEYNNDMSVSHTHACKSVGFYGIEDRNKGKKEADERKPELKLIVGSKLAEDADDEVGLFETMITHLGSF